MHRNLDRFAAIMFTLAVVSVAAYLVLTGGGALRLWPQEIADLVHATDDVVVSEIESWQSVFGGKHVTVPV